MKIWKLPLSLAVSLAACAQGSNIQYDNGVFMPSNPLPSCTGAYQAWNQTATFNWTLWCYDSNYNSKAIRSLPLTATGSGGCPSVLSTACSAPNGSAAPTFTPRWQLNSGTYSMWIDLGTNTVNPVMPPFLYTCGVATTSAAGDPPANRATPQPSICTCDPYNPTCKSTSPIVIDTIGEGFFLTDLVHGVQFRRGPSSPLEQFSWTDPAHHNAWLVRPNQDGSVTSMSMNMFGNLSPQAPSSSPNGYRALAYWAAELGCGELKKLDANACPEVWKSLMLWHDANQNGIAEPGELVTLQDGGIYGISLNYHESQYLDAYGNMFEYRAQTWDSMANGNNRSYDVFLVHR